MLASTFPSANGTYLGQILGPIADGTYTLVARSENLAGNFSYSAPLTITIKANGPKVVPTLALLPADDTGIKGDGVTANHSPRFTGTTDKGVTVNLYALINGQLSGVQATTTSSTINGSFTFSLPFNLTDGTTEVVARASDIAGNKGPLSAPLNLRIITVAGDYYDTGAAQPTIFDPNTESYYVLGGPASVPADHHVVPRHPRPVRLQRRRQDRLRRLPLQRRRVLRHGVQRLADQPAVRRRRRRSLPVSGLLLGTRHVHPAPTTGPNTATWSIALPQPGGLIVKFGVPNLDIPVPAAYDGGGITEIAVFRPSAVGGALGTPASDADSFSVGGPAGYYQVSFTNPAVTKLGFVYKAGDIPAPADYDGVGRDEFAIYRPSTGQFFILNTPNPLNSATWTLRTVTMNLPGGPNANDVPVSEDYDGDGKVDPAVYRPSTSTFFILHSTTGIQQTIQYGLGNFDIAPAGPLLYRLSALKGAFATTGGLSTATTSGSGPAQAITSGSLVHTRSIASASNSSTSSSSTVPSLIAVASPDGVALAGHDADPGGPSPAPPRPRPRLFRDRRSRSGPLRPRSSSRPSPRRSRPRSSPRPRPRPKARSRTKAPGRRPQGPRGRGHAPAEGSQGRPPAKKPHGPSPSP